MARSAKQLEAWKELLELCDDECQVFSTTQDMREAVLQTEKELERLHTLEEITIIFVRKLNKLRNLEVDHGDFDYLIAAFWDNEEIFCKAITDLMPEAFTARSIYEWLQWQKNKLMELRARGHTYEDIGKIIDKTPSQCRAMWAHEKQKLCSECSDDVK